MLSTSTNSSISKRRQLHRRQQSLEAPLLTTPIPAPHRRHQPGPPGPNHRRGQSFDQGLVTQLSPTGFRPLQSQEQTQQGHPSVRIDTNLQHFKQETQQQQIPSQPGFPAQDFQAHLQQQLKGAFVAPVVVPQPTQAHQQALQELQHHLDWYSSTYGSSPNQAPSTPLFDMVQPVCHDMAGATLPMAISGQSQIHNIPTPVSQGHSRTMPNTPQAYTQSWPSPPPSEVKDTRSHSFQLDVAPMAVALAGPLPSNAYAINSQHMSSPIENMMMTHAAHLPTLFEEVPQSTNGPGFHESSLLLQVSGSAVQDFNSPAFNFGQVPIEMSSPRQALLNSLGPDMPASIVETGIPAHEIAQFIGEFSEADKKYPCLYQGCNKRFGRKENVRAHVQTHLGDRQFKCDLCDKTFVRQHDLKRHIAIHSDERPHSCICGQSFARHDALTRHRQRGMCSGALPGYEKDPEDLPKRGRPKKERPSAEDRSEKAKKQRKMNKEKTDEKAKIEQASGGAYASSNYTASDRSFPMTPPDTSDAFEVDAFLSMANVEDQFGNVVSSWRDTPPTSPVTASPTKTVDSLDPRGQLQVQRQDPGISPAMLSNHSSPTVHDHEDSPFEHGSSPPTQTFDHSSPIRTPRGGDSFQGDSSPAEYDIFSDPFDGIDAQPDRNAQVFSPLGGSNTNSSVYNYSDHEPQLFENQLANTNSMNPDNLFNDAMPGTEYGHNDFADMLNSWLVAH